VVGLVDEDDVGAVLHLAELLGKIDLVAGLSRQVGVVVDLQPAVGAAEMGGVEAQGLLPDGLAGGLGDEEGDALALVLDQVLQQHQADEGLAQADAVTQEGAAVAVGDLQQLVEAVLLVLIEDSVDARLVREPLLIGQLLAAVQFVQRLGVDLEGCVIASVALDDAEDFRCDVLGGVPVILVPLLQDGDGPAGDLDIQLDVLGEAGEGEVGGADQAGGADDFKAGVGDVGLGMELRLAVDAAGDLAGTDGLDDGRDAHEEVVLLLLRFEAGIEAVADAPEALDERGASAAGDLVAHEDADLIDLLPLVLQAEQGADLEITGGDVDGAGNLAPVVEVAEDLPVLVAIVHNEQLAARFAGAVRHGMSRCVQGTGALEGANAAVLCQERTGKATRKMDSGRFVAHCRGSRS
jgi:hypothetical protein